MLENHVKGLCDELKLTRNLTRKKIPSSRCMIIPRRRPNLHKSEFRKNKISASCSSLSPSNKFEDSDPTDTEDQCQYDTRHEIICRQSTVKTRFKAVQTVECHSSPKLL